MAKMCLLFLIFLFSCRFIAGYDSRYQNGKYIVIKSPILRKTLIDKTSFGERSNRLKKDINKMSVWGLALYICAAGTLVLVVLLSLNLPQILIEPTDIFFEHVGTLNEKLAVIFIWLFILAVFSYMVISIAWYNKKTEPKWIKILIFAVAGIAVAAAAFVLFEMIKELVMCYKYFV